MTYAALEHEPEPDVLRAVLGILGAIVTPCRVGDPSLTRAGGASRLVPYCLWSPLCGGCRLAHPAEPGDSGLLGCWVQPSAVR
jgi:hypothetical protein